MSLVPLSLGRRLLNATILPTTTAHLVFAYGSFINSKSLQRTIGAISSSHKFSKQRIIPALVRGYKRLWSHKCNRKCYTSVAVTPPALRSSCVNGVHVLSCPNNFRFSMPTSAYLTAPSVPETFHFTRPPPTSPCTLPISSSSNGAHGGAQSLPHGTHPPIVRKLYCSRGV
ncbi:hypothetical protein BC830DRAFT_490572 [Chytriomyces sp. MP71]|nr:hypothetical protein BC830DRAFT_545579 [Chytriomyces sp. MP71]KAI8613267.1 hypothetical protein BC830DRAFT_490572 [Chytriomyces sp. MP71]